MPNKKQIIHFDRDILHIYKRKPVLIVNDWLSVFKFTPIIRRDNPKYEKGFDIYIVGCPRPNEKIEIFASFLKLAPNQFKRIKSYNLSKGDKALEDLILDYTMSLLAKKFKYSMFNSPIGWNYHHDKPPD